MSAHGVAGPRALPLRPQGERVEGDPRLDPTPSPSPRHLRLVGAEELAAVRRRRRVGAGGAVLVVFIIGLLFVAVAMHVVLAQNQFRLDRLTSQAVTEQARYQRLRLQVDQLESPQRIIAAAQGHQGMVAPPGVTYLAPATAAGTAKGATNSAATNSAARRGLAPASPPPGWSAIKPQLTANP